MKVEAGLFDSGPLPTNEKLIRYMSFAKLAHLLYAQAIHFARLDQFRDPLEGRFTVADLAYLRDPKSGADLEGWDEYRRKAYVSCWAAQQRESEAHWRSYEKGHECVALVTTAGKFEAALEAWVPDWPNATYALGKVRYVNPSEQVASELGPGQYRKSLLRFTTLKDMSFRWEEEARAIILPRNAQGADEWPPGVDVPIEPAAFIDKILVAPSSPVWLLDTVRAVSPFELRGRIEKSELVAIYEAHGIAHQSQT